jgi:HSP20 family protein
MANIIRFDPFRELQSIHSAMDQLFDTSFTPTRRVWPRSWDLPIDVIENENDFLIKASIPGIDPDDLEIVFENNVLTIKGEISGYEETDIARYHIRERTFGKFSRSFSLPTLIDETSITADYDAGVLTLNLPKSEEAKPKRIEVKIEPEKQVMLEG